MTKSTIQLGSDDAREAMLTLILTKISFINSKLVSETLSHDKTKEVKDILIMAIRYKKFLSHKNSVVTFTIDDLDVIDSIIDYRI